MDIEWPISLRWARANGLTKLIPWHFLADGEGASADEQFKKERIDLREVRTFAKRQDCDDFAGFLVVNGKITDCVLYFHPSFGSTRNAYMVNSEHESFWEFLRDVVIPDTEDWASGADLKNPI
ncbi:MAG: hypothetical protein JWR26_4090 [Pedosphaera sp.]|nr:hypothetical protein [Pedosphaera sp.]